MTPGDTRSEKDHDAPFATAFARPPATPPKQNRPDRNRPRDASRKPEKDISPVQIMGDEDDPYSSGRSPQHLQSAQQRTIPSTTNQFQRMSLSHPTKRKHHFGSDPFVREGSPSKFGKTVGPNHGPSLPKSPSSSPPADDRALHSASLRHGSHSPYSPRQRGLDKNFASDPKSIRAHSPSPPRDQPDGRERTAETDAMPHPVPPSPANHGGPEGSGAMDTAADEAVPHSEAQPPIVSVPAKPFIPFNSSTSVAKPNDRRDSPESPYNSADEDVEMLDQARPQPNPKQSRSTGEIWNIHLEPDTQPIHSGKLRREVEALYEGVVSSENKCRECVAHEMKESKSPDKNVPRPPGTSTDPSGEQGHHYRVQIGLHRQLCQQYVDLLRATQYAASKANAPPELKTYASQRSLPARLWKHGVHALLEILRKDLPQSQEYLHAYVFLAYHLFTLLLETVDDFQDSWLECLGDLSRYRMAVEYENQRDREQWLETADRWYTRGSMRQPHQGRLLHHRAILARRHGAFPQLNLYARALTTPEAFDIARSSTRQTVFGLALTEKYKLALEEAKKNGDIKAMVVDNFVHMHALNLFYPQSPMIERSWNDLAPFLQSYISSSGSDFGFEGETTALVNIASLFQWNEGTTQVPIPQLRRVFDPLYRPKSHDEALQDASAFKHRIFGMWYKAMGMYALILRMVHIETVYAHVHIVTAFLYCLATAPSGLGLLYFGGDVHWKDVANFLNAALRHERLDLKRLQSPEFIHKEALEWHILPEDRSIRGLLWSQARQEYLPDAFFDRLPMPEEELRTERSTNPTVRRERILWLGMQIAQLGLSETDEDERRMLEGKPWLRFEATESGESKFVVK